MNETHEIHTSERKAFRCKQAWNWGYREQLEPIVGIRPLEFGIAFHAAMQKVYDPTTWYTTTPREKFLAAYGVMKDLIEEQRDRFLIATNQQGLREPSFGDEYGERVELAYGILRHYVLKVHPVEDTWFEPVKVEIPFRVPIYDPNDLTEPLYCDGSPSCGQHHPNPAPITYDGRVDMIVKDLAHGGLLAWDHKTAASLSPNDNFLKKDEQVTSYVMALELMMNLDIKGFIYAEVLKNFPRGLKFHNSGKRYGGRLLSVDKRMLTDYDTAYDSIQELDPEGLEAGAYDDFLENLLSENAPAFIRRFRIPQSKRKLAVAAHDIGHEALDMTDLSIRVYPQPQKAKCNWCAFRDPCDMYMEGEDYKTTLRTLYRQKEVKEDGAIIQWATQVD